MKTKRNVPASTIKAKIARLNIHAESSKLYDDLEDDKKNAIGNTIAFLGNESPVFCYFLSYEYWWVLTDMRIIIRKKNIVESYHYGDIEQILVSDIFELGLSNQECNRLQLLLSSGKLINLDLEINTWFSVLNILKFLHHR